MSRVPLYLLLLTGLAAASASANSWQASRVWVVGTEEHIWVVGAGDSADSDLPVMQMWYAGKAAQSAAPTLLPTLPPISGNPVALGADAEGLRILYADLNQVDYFTHSPLSPGPSWRDQCRRPPLAWCGDATRPILWALVSTADLLVQPTPDAADLVENETAEGKQEQGAESRSQEEEQPILTSPPASGHALLRLERSVWTRHDVIPAADRAERVWLAARDGVAHLFWQQDARVLTSAQRVGVGDPPGAEGNTGAAPGWSDPQIVVQGVKLRHAWAGVTSTGPVFIAAVAGSGDELHLHVHAPDAEGRWDHRGIVRENVDYLVADPLRLGVAVARGELAIARIGEGGVVEFGVSDVSVQSPVRFEPLSLRRPEPTRPTGWRETMSLMLALAILTIVMWTRRQQLTMPIELPVGLMPSATWRRIMATFLDCAPAALVTRLWALQAVPELSLSSGLSSITERWDDPEIQAKLLPLFYTAALLYGLWCLVWEAIMSTTPGKYLFGCRVISVQDRGVDGYNEGPNREGPNREDPNREDPDREDPDREVSPLAEGALLRAESPATAAGDRPRFSQLVVRNMCRVIMVSIGPPGWIITLMMMGMLSRNRQRVGDLMAGTMVVEEGIPIEDRPPDEPQDGQFG